VRQDHTRCLLTTWSDCLREDNKDHERLYWQKKWR